LDFETVPELLAQIASREAALKTLQGALLSLMLIKRGSNSRSAGAGLLDAPELAKRLGVPESWVREQARLGKVPYVRLGRYMRFRLEEVERYLADPANQAA
jgi:excisionase family DNA binding protein